MSITSKISPRETFDALASVYADVIVTAVTHLNMTESDATDATDTVVRRIIESVKSGALLSVTFDDADDPDRQLRARTDAVRTSLTRYMLVSVRRERNAGSHRSLREIHDEQLLMRAVDPRGNPEDVVLSREDVLERSDHLARLRRAVDRLDEPYSRIFTLLLHEHLPLVEVARRLGTGPNSIYKQYQRGAERLRRLMAEDHATGESARFEP